jgi:hypothetical protein
MNTPLREVREMKMTFKGWICADLKDAALLESMGFVLGEYDDMFGTFENCVASETALTNLSPRWGEFVWDLKPVEAPEGEVTKSNATAGPAA